MFEAREKKGFGNAHNKQNMRCLIGVPMHVYN